jgi:hypothetical protein
MSCTSPLCCAVSLLTDKYYSRTVAEAWVVLQVEYRQKLGIHVDYKAAQHEGELQETSIMICL